MRRRILTSAVGMAVVGAACSSAVTMADGDVNSLARVRTVVNDALGKMSLQEQIR